MTSSLWQSTTIARVFVRERDDGTYTVSAYGGHDPGTYGPDDGGEPAPDDAAVLAAVAHVLQADLQWCGEWDATHEGVDGEVVRSARRIQPN